MTEHDQRDPRPFIEAMNDPHDGDVEPDFKSSIWLTPNMSVMLVNLIDGTRGVTPWLWQPNDDDATAGCACWKCAPHEQGGPLSPWITEAIEGRYRCGRTRSNGYRCRTRVAHRGEPCRHHRTIDDAPMPADPDDVLF